MITSKTILYYFCAFVLDLFFTITVRGQNLDLLKEYKPTKTFYVGLNFRKLNIHPVNTYVFTSNTLYSYLVDVKGLHTIDQWNFSFNLGYMTYRQKIHGNFVESGSKTNLTICILEYDYIQKNVYSTLEIGYNLFYHKRKFSLVPSFGINFIDPIKTKELEKSVKRKLVSQNYLGSPYYVPYSYDYPESENVNEYIYNHYHQQLGLLLNIKAGFQFFKHFYLNLETGSIFPNSLFIYRMGTPLSKMEPYYQGELLYKF